MRAAHVQVLLPVLLAIAGCAQQGDRAASAAGAAAEAVASPEGAFLAYEHDVRIQLQAEQISPRIQQVAQACQSATFGDCAVLEVDQRSGERPSGEVTVRIAPKGVEPLIGLAGEGGQTQGRNTRAEDLAQQVADTALTKARLEKEHARLLSYQDRKDLKIEDLMAITTRLSEIEAGVEQANRQAAQQRRRIDTQRVTLHFDTTSGQRSRSEIGEALSESGNILSLSVAFLIRAAAALLPVGIVALLVGWGIRAWLRRRRRKT
ncbi:DUF4349 domain-containing protein [Stenotrophomonas sp. ESTM1D_MKCIP4_1]|uniref:DUF4349 domain-containing protein n=1 Tax=Stenotrophomonas sp. ESTM1D_MKCIP4_1 TaxID=2072414 RepID=UPI000D53F4F6|nr:DUF4349 domain-containing protein [Stenotrophomonas sp. ESTM1D_MKCIP4_1]AWH52831.1 DUF4349 domain-containing protein [Stenotrophomonas sp. ESTM1D_MKCIP4_1]